MHKLIALPDGTPRNTIFCRAFFTDEQSPQAIWQIIVLTGVIGEGTVQSAFTASLNHLPGLTEATLRAGNSMESPVLGFLHVPAGRCFLEKVPNPGRVIVSPLPTASMMMSRAAFKAFPITCGGMLVAPDAAVMSSYFVIHLDSCCSVKVPSPEWTGEGAGHSALSRH